MRARTIVLGLLAWIPLTSVAADRGADGRFDQRRSRHFVLYQDVDIDGRSGWTGSIRFERDVLEVLEAAYDRMDAWLGLRPRHPVTVVVYDPAVFERDFAPWFRFPAAGFTHGTVRIRGDTRVTNELRAVLHHELVHAAFDQIAPSLELPGWLNEGLAEWFAARAASQRHLDAPERAALVQATRAGTLPSLDTLSPPSFAHLEPELAGIAYLESHAFVEFLVRRDGEPSLRELCGRMVRSRDVAGAVHRTYRAPLGELEDRFRREIGAGGSRR